MSKSRHRPRFFITTLDEMLSQALANYLEKKLAIKTPLLTETTPTPRDQDTVFHYGGRPWKRALPGKFCLVIYQTRWNAIERRIWKSRGADRFLSMDGSSRSFDQNLKKLLKT